MGFFGDSAREYRVFYYCEKDGRKHRFVCPSNLRFNVSTQSDPVLSLLMLVLRNVVSDWPVPTYAPRNSIFVVSLDLWSLNSADALLLYQTLGRGFRGSCSSRDGCGNREKGQVSSAAPVQWREFLLEASF